ncbi:MAG: MFS transporter [Myxococcales bacterium]|nr:MFS transporter [Myxococcales bacterium]
MLPAPPLTRSDRFWYGLGQLAEGLKNEGYTVFLLFYYTTVVGLSGALTGQAILIALLFDAVTDPLIGSVSDRLRTRWGRRHPLMFASALPLPVFFFLTFAPPAGLSELGLFAWLATFAVLTRAAMTLFHVPHLALGAELSTDFVERTRIVTLQSFYSRIGSAIAGGLGFLVFLRSTPEFPDGRLNAAAYPPFAFTLACLMFLCVVLSAWLTRSRIPYLPGPDPRSLKEHPIRSLVQGLRDASRMRSFNAIFLGTLVMFVAWGVTVSLGLHLATYFWQVTTTDMVLWGIGAGTGVFVGLGFWLRRASVGDKKPVFIRGTLIFMAATILPPFLRITGSWPGQDDPSYVPLWIVTTGVIAHFGIAAGMVTGRSMMADVTDEDELRTGRRREGMFFGATSFAAKAFFGVGSQIAGFIFDAVGLEKGMEVADAPATVVRDLGLTLGLSVLILMGLSLMFFARFDLTRDRCEQMRAELDARHADGIASSGS